MLPSNVNKSILFFIIGLSLSLNSYAQRQLEDGTINYNLVQIPPSPNAASLGKFTEIPISLNTGIPEISVPLFNIEQGGINIPVAANYHSSGNKVVEEASWIGLGWSLSVGGSITRSVTTRPDDHAGGFVLMGTQIPADNLIDLDIITEGKLSKALGFLAEVSNNKIDYDPDAFFYNLPTSGGSFMYDNHSTFVTIPYSDIKIDEIKTYGEITSFIVTDGNGIVYYFGDTLGRTLNQYIEVTNTNGGAWMVENYISSWLINKIVNPLTGQEIKFYYTTKNVQTSTLSETECWEQDCPYCQRYTQTNNETNISFCNVTAKFLEKIEVNGIPIRFYNSDRLDNNGKKLDSIKFNNQTFIFKYDYFNTNPNSPSFDESRLKLTNVVFSNGILADQKKYSFEYESTTLPSKKSKNVDFWGYYNGADNNTMIPTTTFGIHTFTGGNRNPDFNYAKASILKKIQYPTGGSSEFEYGINTFTKYPTPIEVAFETTTNYTLSADNYLVHDTIYSLDFDPNLGHFDFSIEGNVIVNSVEPPHWLAYVKIIKNATDVIFQKTLTYGDSSGFFSELDSSILENCQLYLKLMNANDMDLSVFIRYKSYDSTNLQTLREYPGGGLRINKITNNDSKGMITIKTFDYCQSGYLTRIEPLYYKVSKLIHVIDPDVGSYETIIKVFKYASPTGGLGSSSNSVSYEKVIEYDGTAEINNGYKISYFRKILDDVTGGAFCPLMSLQYQRNKVISEENYNNFKVLCRTTNYEYEMNPYHNDVIEGFRASKNYTIDQGVYDSDLYKRMFDYGRYNYSLPLEQLKSIQTIENFNNGSISTNKTFQYTYKHLNPIKIITNNSLGENIEEDYKYPLDYVDMNYSTCKDQYINDLVDCSALFDQCYDDALSCNEIYGDCYTAFLDNVTEFWTKFDIYYYPREDTLKRDSATINERFVAWVMRTRMMEYEFPQADCQEDEGWSDCVNNLSCGYIPCILISNMNYCNCIDSITFSLSDLYNNCSDYQLKAIYDLIFFGCNNVLLEKMTTVNGELVSHIKNVYKEYPLTSIQAMPVLDKVLDLKMDTHLSTLITYDKVDDYSNITQLTESGKSSSSFIWGSNKKKDLISQVLNSTDAECGYTGFENKELNDWNKDEHNAFDDHEFFTGTSCISVENGYGPSREFKVGVQAASHNGYQASVWVKGSKYAYLHIETNGWSIHERVSNEDGSEGGWHLLNVILYKHQYESLIDSNFKIKVYVGIDGGEESAYFDDLRFYPLDAQMTTYTYIPLVGTTSISDNNNKPTRYEYDRFGRLTHIRDFQDNIVKKYDYHYKP